MNFSDEQLTAIYQVAFMMAGADGKIDPKEIQCLTSESMRLGISLEKAQYLSNAAAAMSPERAVLIISKLDAEAKKYVASFLCVIMSADGNIDDRELTFLFTLSRTCGLPNISVAEARRNMENFH